MDRKATNNDPGAIGGKKSSGGSANANPNPILPPGLTAEPNLAELFAAHNLLASTGMSGHGSNPLALLQQQMNMQYASPAAWWYLEYLSRIQAAQMVPNLQSGSTGVGGGNSLGGRDREQHEPREPPHRGGRHSTAGDGEGRRKSGKQSSQAQSAEAAATHAAHPPAQRNSQGTSRRNDRDGGTAARTTSRRGRGANSAAAAAAAAAAATTSHTQVAPVQLLPMTTSRSATSQALSLSNSNSNSRNDHQQPLALNLSKNTPKHTPNISSVPGCGGEASNSKSLNLPSSVTIIPHAHSKPDSLTSPRFPSDYVPKPAHMSNPNLYSHTVPKSPQLGLVKGEKVKRKSTVASLLQQSRAAGGGGTLGGNVEIMPKSDRLEYQAKPSRSNEKNQDVHHNADKPMKLDKASSSASSSGGGRTSDRNASPLMMQQGQLVSQRSTPEKIMPTSSTPPHRPWLNTTELNIPQPKPKAEPDLNAPLQNGWRRETLLKGLSPHGLNGEVSYISPNNVTVKSVQELKKVIGNTGLKNYSFSCKLLIGDFLLPGEDGNILKLTSNELANWLKEEARQNKKEEERVRGERERKKEHAALVRALELFRRSRRRYKLQQERKLKKRAENLQEPEVKSEPVEIDEVLAEKKLKDLDDIKGLRLSPQAFANMLHIYEFLHTFGNTLGFDMESLPSLSNLQKAFLHIDENEEELLSVLSHLLVCAVEDPGMPNPNKHMTAFGQTLKQADITFGSLSEVLRLYLSAVCDSEPEAVKFSEWLNEAPFLALSPTRKSSIISFICDLLLQNKAVLKHLESSTESAHSSRKERQQNEIKIRRLRILCARKTVAAVAAENEKIEGEEEEMDEKVAIKEEPTGIDAGKKLKIEAEVGIKFSTASHYSNGTIMKAEVEKAIKKEESPLDEGLKIKDEPMEIENSEGLMKSGETMKSENLQLQSATNEIPHDSTYLTPNANSHPSRDQTIKFDGHIFEPPAIDSFLNDTDSKKSVPSATDTEDTSKLDMKLIPADDDASFLASSSSSEESDSDAKLSVDEIRQKMNSLQKATDKLKHLQTSSMRVIRSICLGQDRYRRRYWNLPAAGGVYVEGGASGEFDELKLRVKQKFQNGDSVLSTLVTKEEEEKPKDAFDVPPPCIKIFSFTPREGCSGKAKEIPVKEEDKKEDENLIAAIEPKCWDSWWKLDNHIEEFVQNFCPSGIRESALKVALSNLTSPPSLVEDELDDEEIPLNVRSPSNGWDPELTYKVHLQLLEATETLEERVASASLQVKGWQIPARPSMDLTEETIIGLVKERLLGLESAIERRYLKPPLGKSAHDSNLLANVAEGGTDIYVGSKALMHWREAINRATTPAVLSMAVYSLDSSIAWDKSVMKASCQLCKGGDHEDKLLLCDACDRGYHTYCFKPPLETIPDGDWFCWECINKATGTKGCIVCGKGAEHGKIIACDKCANKAYHIECIQPQLHKVPRGRWHCPDHKSPTKKRKSDSVDGNAAGPSKKSTKKIKSEMVWCEKLLDDLTRHEDAWPFLEPVNTRQFPTYKKIIKNPMDLASIRTKMPSYKTKAEFLGDIRLIFDNCLTFNEDDSPVGKAGHNLRVFFDAASSKI